jgi:N-acetylmuramoyl-L-alanine amidase
MIQKIFSQGIITALLGLSLAPVVAAAELRGIHLSSEADSAQLTLDLDQSVAQRVFTLERPNRVVIDLRHTRNSAGLRAPSPLGAVTAVRLGLQPDGTLRVVVETKSALAPHSVWSAHAGEPQLLVSLGQAPPAPLSAEAAPVHAVHAPDEGSRDVIIAVDAGHGGQDPGAIGHGGTREKDVTLAIARALAERINAEPGMRAVLTRDHDEFLELRDRIHRARLARADMFVSVHADSIADRSVSGASVYVLSAHGASKIGRAHV